MRTGQVFVSHTSDLAQFPGGRSFVQGALDAVSRAGMVPVEMRYFAAQGVRPADYCRQRVRESEIFVAVVGFRYGSLVPGEPVSYTELEFQAASEAALPRLTFLLEETACLPGMADADRGLVEAFRQRLRDAGLVVRAFGSVDGLELEIFHALSELTSGGTVPRIWNVPNRNADFTGRDAILEKLHEDLGGERPAVVLARALYGLGGVGKTQVALEYAHRYQADYDLIWWIPAEQPQGISLALAELADRLGFQTSDNAAEAATAALERLRRGAAGRWLLVFDNADDPRDLEPYLPTGSGHVVITSRNHAWSHRAVPLEVGIFTRNESVAHLMSHVPGLDPRDAEKISAAVGDLPLAIEQAAAWLAETGMPAALYVERLTTQVTSALGLNKPFDYALPVAATWNLSLDRLRQRSPAAVRLLQILAFCSPEPISMTLLYSREMNASLLPFDQALSEPLMLGRVIGELSRLALVKVDQGSNSLQIHRLVQAVIRSQMTEEAQGEARHEVHKVLVGARPREGETDDPANWSTYDIIWPHLEPSGAAECDQDGARQLLIDWVRYQWKRSEFESALSLANSLQDLWQNQLGPNHQQTLHLQFQIANVLRSQGRFGESRDLDTRVLKRQRVTLGADHLQALMTAGGLGADLRALGDYKRALALDQQTYESFREHFGEGHLRTQMAGHNLACSLRLAGDFSAALLLDRDTFNWARATMSFEHPLTLLTAAYLALDMRVTGAFKQSADLLRTTYEKYRTVLGDELLETLSTANSLAISLRKMGIVNRAMELTQKTHDRYLQRYGRLAPDALSCTLNLASCHAALGDIGQALRLAAEVENSYRSALSENHSYSLAAANNLAIYLRESGELEEAYRLAEQTLTIMRNQLGDSHPYSLSCTINLANCLADAEDLAGAQTLERETLSRLQEKLGLRHPDTLACAANLAVTLRRAGHDQEAGDARARILYELGRVLGPGHPDAIQLRAWQSIDRDLEPLPI
jgi:tetratricopeptide (TPR) repeat protein